MVLLNNVHVMKVTEVRRVACLIRNTFAKS